MQQPNTNILFNIANTFGTPVYVYDANTITYQFNKLTNAFKNSDVKFFYASKALTNLNILKHMVNIGANIDCSSINEVKLAIHAGVSAEKILYTSNGIAFSEIEEAQHLGVIINIDSISNVEKFGKKFGNSYPIGLRLRPNIMAGGNLKISTGHNKSKFGIPVDQINEVLAVIKQYNIHVSGLHIHTGSEIKDVAVFVKGIEVLFDLIPLFDNLQYIDLGGGFKVPYKDGDSETDIELLAKEVKACFDNHPYHKPLEIWFEPGKYLVSQAGFLLSKVNVIKKTSNTCFVGIDTGFNHLIRPMFYDAYHKITNISNENGPEKTYTIVGNICETDTFATDRKMNEIRENDLLLFHNAGAYGFEMSSNFNSRFKPAEVLIKNDNVHLIRKRDTFEDLIQNQLIID